MAMKSLETFFLNLAKGTGLSGLTGMRPINGKIVRPLILRPKRVLTPLKGVHKAVGMAVERGVFQNLIFDNRVLFSHRALPAGLGVLLRLPPINQVMESEQIKSRYF